MVIEIEIPVNYQSVGTKGEFYEKNGDKKSHDCRFFKGTVARDFFGCFLLS